MILYPLPALHAMQTWCYNCATFPSSIRGTARLVVVPCLLLVLLEACKAGHVCMAGYAAEPLPCSTCSSESPVANFCEAGEGTPTNAHKTTTRKPRHTNTPHAQIDLSQSFEEQAPKKKLLEPCPGDGCASSGGQPSVAWNLIAECRPFNCNHVQAVVFFCFFSSAVACKHMSQQSLSIGQLKSQRFGTMRIAAVGTSRGKPMPAGQSGAKS